MFTPKRRKPPLGVHAGLIILCACVMVGAGAFYWAAKTVANKEADRKLNALASRYSDKLSVFWDRVDVRLLSRDVVIKGISIRMKNGFHARIDRLFADDYYKKLPHPNFATIKLSGVHLPVVGANFGAMAAKIRAFGYEAIDADLNLDLFFDSLHRTFYLNALELADPKIGALKLRVVLKQFLPDQLKKGALEDLILKDAELAYQDVSLLKELALLARQQDTDFIEFLISCLETDIAAAYQAASDSEAGSMAALKRFLQHPQQLRLKINLLKPLRLGDLLLFKKMSDFLDLISYQFSTA